MQIEKSILIPNIASDPIATAIVGTSIIKSIEDNVRILTKQVKELQEWNTQLEQENTQSKINWNHIHQCYLY